MIPALHEHKGRSCLRARGMASIGVQARGPGGGGGELQTMPVLSPGRNRVPRCRTMMFPGLQRWLSNSLHPRFLGCDSRPF